MRKILTIAAIFFALFSVSAEKVKIKGNNFKGVIFYDNVNYPGDAVFVRISLDKKSRLAKNSTEQTAGEVKIYSSQENDEQSLKPKGQNIFWSMNIENGFHNSASKKDVVLTGIPLSTYFKPGLYKIDINLNAFGVEEASFTLPLEIKEKEFLSETIPLNEKNTGIRTNYSKERMAQIERLNKIFDTKNAQGIWQSKSFSVPCESTRYTSYFGDRRVFAYSNGKTSTTLHYGKDYGVPTGTEVKSCARGKVVLAEDRISTGWSVVIEHLPGLYSIYYHMSRLDVQEGQIVEQGKLLGLSGATGLATGPHLHWEMRFNMEAVNPDYFTKDFAFFNAK